MRTSLSQAEIDQYRRDGFVVLAEFLDSDELEQWRRATDEAIEARLALDDELSNKASDPYYSRVFTQASGLRRVHEGMHRLVCDARIAEVAGRLAGVDGIRLWNEQALYKQPFANPTGWHLDVPYWSFDDRRALTAWIALDDATVENGCLWYLPGTHLTAGFDAVDIGPNLRGILDVHPEWRAIESAAAPVPAGGVVWHNGLVAHAAGANMTNGGRRAMTVAYMPDGVTYNGKRDEFVYTEGQAAAMAVGDVLDDEETNPLLWPRSTIAAIGG
jgi:ectoine hydroxylase-related dioxygenase (phytanoyl-CoA dioxygenase family)